LAHPFFAVGAVNGILAIVVRKPLVHKGCSGLPRSLHNQPQHFLLFSFARSNFFDFL